MKINKIDRYLLKASFFGTFAETLLLPVWATLVKRVGGDIVDAGIGFALFALCTGLAVMIIGQTKWYNKNVKTMVFWGFLIAGIGDFGYIFCHNKWELFFVQACIGISVGLLNPAWDSIYSDDIEEGEAGKKWSIWSGGIEFVVGLAAITGAIILKLFGWNALFISMAIFDTPGVYYAYKVWREYEAS